jgi:hypothetical protein
MGQGSHNSPSRILTQGSLIPTTELFWVRTCSLDKIGVRRPLSPSRRHTPGARRIASGSPRWRRAARCWLLAAGGQATFRATLMCLGQLACTTKVTPLDPLQLARSSAEGGNRVWRRTAQVVIDRVMATCWGTRATAMLARTRITARSLGAAVWCPEARPEA